MLFFSYKHLAGENNALVPDTIPTDEANGYSHQYLGSMGYTADDIQDLRFYCESSGHTRVMNFKTSNANIKTIAVSGNQAGNTAASWNVGFTALPGHTAFLPAVTDTAPTNATGGLDHFPFYKIHHYHWTLQGFGNYWECDDFPGDNSLTTRHNIWVRMVDNSR